MKFGVGDLRYMWSSNQILSLFL